MVKSDQVVLKSGGPRMTVKEVLEEDVCCVWTDSKGEIHCDIFDPEILEIYTPPKEGPFGAAIFRPFR